MIYPKVCSPIFDSLQLTDFPVERSKKSLTCIQLSEISSIDSIRQILIAFGKIENFFYNSVPNEFFPFQFGRSNKLHIGSLTYKYLIINS